MKTAIFFVTTLFLLAGCSGTKESGDQNDSLITIDITKKYPKKTLILQDILDVEYIPLESSDEFLTQATPLAVGDKYVLVRSHAGRREMHLFSRTGKGIRKIDRFGESGEEYSYNYNSILDEDNEEIIVCDRKILVYDLEGNFKRSFDPMKDVIMQDITNFGKDAFIWCNFTHSFNLDAEEAPSFFVTSKQDGSTIREIEIPFEERKSTVIMWQEGDIYYSLSPRNKTVIPYKDEWILTEASSDTVYRYTRDHQLIPFIARTPSVQSQNPEMFLLPGIITDRYVFMEINTKIRDSENVSLGYDRQTGETFQYEVYNNDYDNKEPVRMYSMGRHGNPNIAFVWQLNADRLLESYENNKLKGKLKEIAANLDDEANDVIMVARFKK